MSRKNRSSCTRITCIIGKITGGLVSLSFLVSKIVIMFVSRPRTLLSCVLQVFQLDLSMIQ
ncbi:uncharacterized protein M6B38_146605 [Iris pallida]|uniref:Uncharacterized protein n=1 Tax=Iris pallida TaxID=29817 RepID=A0AAX6F9U2_IRIPA|nr:uncharacterized protein M6B38_146605 [Iris pallida]